MKGNLAISIKITEQHIRLQPSHSGGFILQMQLLMWEMTVASLVIAELFDKSKVGEWSECPLEKDYVTYQAGPYHMLCSHDSE